MWQLLITILPKINYQFLLFTQYFCILIFLILLISRTRCCPTKEKKPHLDKMKTFPFTIKIHGFCQIPPLHVGFRTIWAVRAVKWVLVFWVCNFQPVSSHYIWDMLIWHSSSNMVHKGHIQNRFILPYPALLLQTLYASKMNIQKWRNKNRYKALKSFIASQQVNGVLD